MSINDQTQNGIAEATRLTQQGRLEEATAAIQRALGGTYFPASSPGGSGGADGPIDVASQPTLLTRGVQRPPGMKAGNLTSVNVPRERVSSSGRTPTARGPVP